MAAPLVASNRQLSREFGRGFNSITSTLEWGFDRLEFVLQDVNASIDSLHSDFNYSMGLLLEEVQITNGLLTDLLGKLDEIHRTLERPTLTQAREFYNIGRDRLAKGLLDKALEAFKEAEVKNDTDFFTQFHIGKLYLYGIDADNNILDLQQAKEHLLLASRYAKAEIAVDREFAPLAGEALLHASIAVYAQLGERNIVGDAVRTTDLLKEAQRLAFEAVGLAPQLSESFYHAAKFSALLGETQVSIKHLVKAIGADRRYAVKVDVDQAFNPIRPHVVKLLSELKDGKENECQNKLKQASELFAEISLWHPEESGTLASQFLKCKEEMTNAQLEFNRKTYFGFLDAGLVLDTLLVELRQLKARRIAEMEMQVIEIVKSARGRLPEEGDYSLSVSNASQEAKGLISQALTKLDANTYAAFQSALSLAQSADEKAISVNERVLAEDLEKTRAAELRANRAKWSKGYALGGAWALGIIGGLGGCVDCINHLNKPTTSAFNLITGAILGAVVGFIVGGVIGTVRK